MADRLVRGRIAVAAASAVVGLICAIGGLAWPAAPLLIAALVVAAATLLATVATRHLELTPRARVTVTALLLVIDTTVLVAGIVVGGRIDFGLFLSALLLSSIAVHVRGLARIASVPLQEESAAASAGTGEIATRAREAIGIVRARAESLKLAAEEAGLAELIGHDLEVLVHQAEECQRALRELDRATARLPASRRTPGPPERRAATLPECPRESTPLRS